MDAQKKSRKKMDPDVSVHLRYLYQDMGLKCAEICKRYPDIPRSTIRHHMSLPIKKERGDRRKNNKGRPGLLTSRDKRNLLSTLQKLRDTHGPSFNSRKLAVEAGVLHVSNRTVRRYLNKEEYGYHQLRKKGLLTKDDRKKRVAFAEQVKKLKGDLWKKGISFYLDGVSFAHKYNTNDTAKSHGSMAWRKKNEGLKQTAKGKKEGAGTKRMAKFMVAIAYDKGVVACEQYKGQITGDLFAEIVRKSFPDWMEKSANPNGKRFLQDGDPSQQSAVARRAWTELGCVEQPIPPRSPDLNPIENMFNNIRNELREEAIQKRITYENFEQFSARVKRTMEKYPLKTINKTIESMDTRMNMIIDGHGHRTKY